jgi:hypothetical protein
MDHKNLEYFMTAKLNHHQAQWSLYLSRFDFTMHHRPGCSMGKSNALSRKADHSTGGEITVMLPYFAQSSLQPMQSTPSLDCHQKERNMIFSMISEVKTMWENRRMQL